MTEECYPMKLNEEYYVCLANDLILGRQKTMSIWANRIINFLVMQLVAEDTEFKTHTVRIKELAEFIGILPDGKLYETIKESIEEIMKNVVHIGNRDDPSKPWKLFHWVSYAAYDGNGTLKLCLSNEVKPYLLDLKSKGFFTQFQIKEILPMNSFYAIRLYQYITMMDKKSRSNCNYIEMTIKELREYLECTDKFKQISQLKKGVIEVAVNQINNNPNSEYRIEVEYIKTGRTVTHIKFYLYYGKLRQVVLREK